MAKQRKFGDKLRLPYPLLADPDHAACEAYGVWQDKSFMGRQYKGIERTTFLIDRQGIIRCVWEKVKVAGHAAEVLARAREELARE